MAEDVVAFTADSGTSNSGGTFELKAKSTGGDIDVSGADNTGTPSYTLTGGAGTDTLTGDGGNDTFKIAASGEGNSDTFVGGGGSTDTIQLSAGSHTFSTDSKIATIEVVKTDSTSGSTVNLGGQTEGFTIQGDAQIDNITCLLYTSPSPRDATLSRMPSSA